MGTVREVLGERVGEVDPLSGNEKLSTTPGPSSLDLAFLVAEFGSGAKASTKLVSIPSVQSVEDLVRAISRRSFQSFSTGRDKPITAAVKRDQTKRRGESGG